MLSVVVQNHVGILRRTRYRVNPLPITYCWTRYAALYPRTEYKDRYFVRTGYAGW